MPNDPNLPPPFGFGPFDENGLPVCPPNPAGMGFGGTTDPDAGALYGFSPYGSGELPRPPFPPYEGYGALPYGTSPYGAGDATGPWIISAIAVNGLELLVMFSEPVLAVAALDPANWTITPVLGCTPAVESISTVLVGGTPDPSGGVMGVIVHHSGTTLGGRYAVTVDALEDTLGNAAVEGHNTDGFLALGDPPELEAVLAVTDSGKYVAAKFTRPVDLGADDPASYSLASDYPVVPVITHAERTSNHEWVILGVAGMTSVEYLLTAGPSDAVSYDPASGMPSQADVELGAGESTVIEGNPSAAPAALLLSKEAGVPYGWHFSDAGSGLVPGCTFRTDVSFDASVAAWYPAVNSEALAIHVCDGGVQASLVLSLSSVSSTLTLSSGSVSVTAAGIWSSGPTTVSVLRNMASDHWSVLLNGVPIICVPASGAGSPDGAPVMAAGVQVVLASSYIVHQLPIYGVSLTASSTLFGTDLNFVHGEEDTFIGSAELALDTLWTERGPLTKGWGDGRPASKEDVSVTVNGVEVGVSSINPFLGQVRTEIPIPRMAAGSMSVEVDYTWFPSPRMAMGGLNMPGVVLNKWDASSSRRSSSSDSWVGGGPDEGTRFPMSLALVRPERPRPKLTSHRYIGFERGYTACLNDATTLTLNTDPHAHGPAKVFDTYLPVSGSWESESSEGWDVSGDILQEAATTSGWGALTSSGPSSLAQGLEAAVAPGSFQVAARIAVPDPLEAGFWVGPALGFHDILTARLSACVSFNGLRHIGILDGDDFTDPASWIIGPRAECGFSQGGVWLEGGAVSVPPGQLPELAAAGQRIQIPEGSQAGVYTVQSIDELSDGTFVLYLEEDFPVDPGLWGNGSGTVLFEADWSSVFTWVVSSGSSGAISVTFSGTTIASIESSGPGPHASVMPSGVVDLDGEGQIIWGHPFGAAASEWDFLRYSFVPDSAITHSAGHVVTAEMSDLPEERGPWVRSGHFGTSEVVGDGTIRMRSEAATLASSGSGYRSIDPLVPDDVSVEFQYEVAVEDGFSGWGDAGFYMAGPERVVLVSSISYALWPDGSYRVLSMPTLTLAGDAMPEVRGWEEEGTLKIAAEGRRLRLTAGSADVGSLHGILPLENPYLDGVSRVLETRLAVVGYQAGSDDHVGLVIGMDAFAPTRTAALCLRANPARVCLTSSGSTLAEFAFPWDDGEDHVYRLVADQSLAEPAVILSVDGVVLGSADADVFESATPSGSSAFVVVYGDSSLEVELASLSARVMPPAQIRRTLGIFNGGPPDELSSWELPRAADGSIVDMDWRSMMSVRVVVDPEWGASLYRPDLPPPPGATEDLRATQRTNPTAAWATLEWADLPLKRADSALLAFGAVSPGAVSTALWDRFRYRVYLTEDEGILPLRGAVLNRWNIITSGELGSDLTIEERSIPVADGVVSIRTAHVNASRVFSVWIDGGQVPFGSWDFDREAQVISFTSPVEGLALVKFSPGPPVTTSYLASQPVRDGNTNLNEGTPPMPRHQVNGPVRTYIPGSRLNEWSDTLNDDPDFILNDPAGFVTAASDPDSLYSSMSFMEIEDGGEEGLISTPDDGPAPALGFAGIELSGRILVEGSAPLPRPAHEQRGGAMGGLLHAGGGAFSHDTGKLGGGASANAGAALWPTAPSRPSAPGPGAAGTRTLWDIRPLHLEDGTVPTEAACHYILEDASGASGYSRIGPWGGLEALTDQSLISGGPDSLVGGIVLAGGGSLTAPSRIEGQLLP